MLARACAQDLFATALVQLVDDGEGGIRYWPGFVSDALAKQWFQALHSKAAWTHLQRPMYDRIVDVPRLLASYRLDVTPPELPLAEMLARIQQKVPAPYNAVGLNLYRNGDDSVAMHNDKLHTLAGGYPIALISLGDPESYNHFAVGWAHAMNTPLQWTKQVASHWGGTRNGTVVHWPKGIQAKGEQRMQFAHVIDVAPTILEAAGIPEPLSVDGIQQDPIDGVSMLHTFNDAGAPEHHETQYFEVMGNRAIYHKGWTAVTKHYTPWINTPRVPLDEDVWELYDTNKDWSQSKDLSKDMPDKLRELQRLFIIEATRNKVLPLDDRMFEKMNPDTAGRPVLIKGKTQLLAGGMGHLGENCMLSIKNKSHTVTAEIVVPEGGAEGVIIAQGADIGGWALYALNGKLKYCYNWGGFKYFMIEGETVMSEGEHQVRMEFAYAGGGLGKGGKATLYVDGKKDGEGDIEATLANVFSADDGCDVGRDGGSSVSPDYVAGKNAFNGKVKGVVLSLGDDDGKHVIDPADAIRIAMARQ